MLCDASSAFSSNFRFKFRFLNWLKRENIMIMERYSDASYNNLLFFTCVGELMIQQRREPSGKHG